jgi:hypothetical protein
MDTITLWRDKDKRVVVNLQYIGEGVVLESTAVHNNPHYFDNRGKALEFMIENAYGLMQMGFEIYDES